MTEAKRFTVTAFNKDKQSKEWVGEFKFESRALDAAYKLATSNDWSKARTNSTIVFIVYDNDLLKEIDRYENK